MRIRSVVGALVAALVLAGCSGIGATDAVETDSTAAEQCVRIPSNEFTHSRDSMLVSNVGAQFMEDGFEVVELRRMSDDERYRQQLGAECGDVFAVLRTASGFERAVTTQKLGTVYVGRVVDGRWVFCEGSGLPNYRKVLDLLALDTPENPVNCGHNNPL